MEVSFSKHALEQLEIRSIITKVMVLDTLTNSDEVLESYRGRKVYRKKIGEEYLEVVTVIEDNKLIVVTQYILEN